MGQIFDNVQKMQAQMEELQQTLAQRSFEGSAGAGMVSATVTGELRVREIRIEPDFFAQGDLALIQDLTAAAVNAALNNAQRGVQEEFQKLTGGMVVPGIPGLPGK
jgi:hypothetical protein